MKGKRLSISDLEKLPIGTTVSVERGFFYLDYKVYRQDEKICLKAMNPSLHTLYYDDILRLDIYESTREVEQLIFDKEWIGVMPCVIGIDWAYDNSNNKQSVLKEYFNYKPEITMQREFNIAKKKENEVKPLSGDQKYRLNKARLEMMVDIALEEGNKDDFIKFSGKLKKYYTKECRV